jgi:tetratricopeptide (TPR) repeat protein
MRLSSRSTTTTQEPWFDRAHSVYFDWLIFGGLPALLLFIALLVSAVIALYRSSLSRPERILLITAIAAYAFQALFVFDNLFNYILLAVILAAAHAASSRPIPWLENVPELKDPTTFNAAVLPVVLIGLLGSIWMVNINNIEAGKALIRGATSKDPVAALSHYRAALAKGSFAEQEIREQLITFASGIARQQTVPVAFKQEALVLAFTEMDKQITKVPGDARVLLQYAKGLEGVSEFDASLKMIALAEAQAPKKQTLIMQKGMVLWKKGDYQAAQQAFLAAYMLDESFEEAAVYAAAGYVIAGSAKDADMFLLEKFGTTTLDHEIMRFAYFEAKDFNKLIESSRLSVANNPKEPLLRFQLAQAYAGAGRVAEARAVIQETVALFPDQQALATELLRQIDTPIKQ